MNSVAGLFILGVLLIALGISNCKGNISSLHRYHRARVTEENRVPFGKMVGLGTIICGVSVIVYGGCTILADASQTGTYLVVGTVLLIAGLAAGLVLSLYAMVKYNGGIF